LHIKINENAGYAVSFGKQKINTILLSEKYTTGFSKHIIKTAGQDSMMLQNWCKQYPTTNACYDKDTQFSAGPGGSLL
jgi:hypothetical protein